MEISCHRLLWEYLVCDKYLMKCMVGYYTSICVYEGYQASEVRSSHMSLIEILVYIYIECDLKKCMDRLSCM